MKHLLLLGAGFSRNWGGWLAAEVMEYLLGAPEVQDNVYFRNLLWKHKHTDGFEGALTEAREMMQRGSAASRAQYAAIQNAIASMFADMNRVFERATFEFSNDRELSVTSFLTRFDAIFTLNQDLLLEQHYLSSQNVILQTPRRWDGATTPGITLAERWAGPIDYSSSTWRLTGEHSIPARTQPCFKLHGSSGWRGVDGDEIQIIGGNKVEGISATPLLRWYHQQFREYLAAGGTRLMVIGYGFGDHHINKAILDATSAGVGVFVIDPLGVDVVNPHRGALIRASVPMEELIVGASRRSLRETFGGDRVELRKIMRFFN